jgi:hypothetical protein
VLAQFGKRGIWVTIDIIRKIEGVQPIDADQQHVPDRMLSSQRAVRLGRQCRERSEPKTQSHQNSVDFHETPLF